MPSHHITDCAVMSQNLICAMLIKKLNSKHDKEITFPCVSFIPPPVIDAIFILIRLNIVCTHIPLRFVKCQNHFTPAQYQYHPVVMQDHYYISILLRKCEDFT